MVKEEDGDNQPEIINVIQNTAASGLFFAVLKNPKIRDDRTEFQVLVPNFLFFIHKQTCSRSSMRWAWNFNSSSPVLIKKKKKKFLHLSSYIRPGPCLIGFGVRIQCLICPPGPSLSHQVSFFFSFFKGVLLARE